MLKSIKREIAKRILSERHEKWWTVPTCFNEIDTLRDKYTNENDQEKLKFLDELNDFVMSIQKNMKMFSVDNYNLLFLLVELMK